VDTSLEEEIDSIFLYDDKELYVQPLDEDQAAIQLRMPSQSTSQKNSYYILVREFNSHLWTLGDIHEVQIDKSVKCNDLGRFL
jgi:hypothetical protein